MTTVAEIISDIQEIGFINFKEIKDKIRSINPEKFAPYLNKIEHSINELKSNINIVINETPEDLTPWEDSRIVAEFKIDILRLNKIAILLKHEDNELLTNLAFHTACVESKQLIINDFDKSEKQSEIYNKSMEIIAAIVMDICGNLRSLLFMFESLYRTGKAVTDDLNSVRRLAGLSELWYGTNEFDCTYVISLRPWN